MGLRERAVRSEGVSAALAKWGMIAVGGAFVCIGLAIALSGCRSEKALTRQEAAGKHLYQARCAHCHEDNDLALKKIPPDLHEVFSRKNLPSGAPATDASVRQNVLAGKGMMPGFNGRFTEEQMAALIAYLHTGLR
ncbi:MAG: cytochrome c [Terracidiphilus sp.]